jgi:thioredoxin 1
MNVYFKGELVRSIVGVRPKSAILNELSEFA